jgi:hypothetical protein
MRIAGAGLRRTWPTSLIELEVSYNEIRQFLPAGLAEWPRRGYLFLDGVMPSEFAIKRTLARRITPAADLNLGAVPEGR